MLQTAIRRQVKATSRRALFEPMEARQLMSATAVKSLDTAGPDSELLTVSGTTYIISSSRSGGGWSQIYSTKGPSATTKHLVDADKDGKLGTIENLVGTADGRVFFTAAGGVGGGFQLFQLNTSKGGYTQITKDDQANYSQVMAIGNKIYMYDWGHERIVTLDSSNKTKVVVSDVEVTKLFQAKGQLFFNKQNDGIYRTDGTTAGTYKISGSLSVSVNDIFVSTDWIYFEGSLNNNTSLYRSDGSKSAPVKIADDFSLLNSSSAELGDYVYFSGGYYNTSPQPDDGYQLFRVKSLTGEVSIAANIVGADGAGRADAIHAVGTNIYYTAGDGDYIDSIGDTDRELYRYDTLTGVNHKITTDETLYPVDDRGDGGGAGVLSSYYFTASPIKDDARWGARKIYRTNPTNDKIEEVKGLPAMHQNTAELQGFMVGPGGLFANIDLPDDSGDGDTFFVPTPFSYIDPVTKKLTIEGSGANDTLQVKVVGSNLSMTLNGITETQALSAFDKIDVYLKDGNDKLTTDANVTRDMNVFGDSGDDYLQTGSGDDYVLTGAGKNTVYGGAGEDKLKGAAGQDKMYGEDGADVLWGRAGSDILDGGAEIDVLRGDDTSGAQGNDTLRGGSSNDRLYGYGGNDQLEGGKQNDSMVGGAGDDVLIGDVGDDRLDGGTGIDDLRGGDGNDTFIADDGALDLLDGGAGTDSAKKDADEKKLFSIETIL